MRLTDNDWAGLLKRVHALETNFVTFKSMIETLTKEIDELKQKLFINLEYQVPPKPTPPEMPPKSPPRIVKENGKVVKEIE